MRQVDEWFVCEHCGKRHKTEGAYNKCVLGHDIVYIGLERQEWKAIIRDIINAHNWGFPFEEKSVEKLLKYKIGVKR